MSPGASHQPARKASQLASRIRQLATTTMMRPRNGLVR